MIRHGTEASEPQARLYYRAKEVAGLLGIALRTVYEGIYAGWIPSRKVGNSRLIPASWLFDQQDARPLPPRVADRYIPKNRYSLGNCVRASRTQSRLLRIALSHEMRIHRAA